MNEKVITIANLITLIVITLSGFFTIEKKAKIRILMVEIGFKYTLITYTLLDNCYDARCFCFSLLKDENKWWDGFSTLKILTPKIEEE